MQKLNLNDVSLSGRYFLVPVNKMTRLMYLKESNQQFLVVQPQKILHKNLLFVGLTGRFSVSDFRSTDKYIRITLNKIAFNMFVNEVDANDYVERKAFKEIIVERFSSSNRESLLSKMSKDDLFTLHLLISKY